MVVSETRFFLKPAVLSDAAQVYALIVEAFAGNMLPYTVFQAPQSINYLNDLITPDLHSAQVLVVAREDADPLARIAGYYQAMERHSDFFLSYIAVAQWVQGHGLGSLLIQHYEDKGRALGCSVFKLDVFESNQRAKRMYQRRGYRQIGSDYCAHVALRPMREGQPVTLDFDENALNKALQQEARQGFSKLECTCKNGHLSLGLIAGRTCRLLSLEGADLGESIRAIAHRFSDSRETVIIMGLPGVPDSWPVVSVERVCHLSKTVSADRGQTC